MFISIDKPRIKTWGGVLGGTTCFCTAITAALMKILINNVKMDPWYWISFSVQGKLFWFECSLGNYLPLSKVVIIQTLNPCVSYFVSLIKINLLKMFRGLRIFSIVFCEDIGLVMSKIKFLNVHWKLCKKCFVEKL